MKIYLFLQRSFLLYFFILWNTALAEPDPEILKSGEKLYNGAGSCVACHMPDGNGQPGTIPPLAGSDWLDNPDRTIAITLRGLAGPVKVNGKRYYSAMPPQLLFDDEKIAHIITYVNNAWGNNGPAVTKEQVAEARANLPPELYSPASILKAFPFEKKKQKANGTFKPDFDDALTNVTEPVVYRTFMPGASPAAFAVALPGNQFFCWDAGECRLRYAWSKGGFIRGNKVHWSSNGKPVAEFNGVPYYRARSSLLNPEDYEHLAKTNRKTPFYDTSEAPDFPIVIEGIDELPKFKGYRLVDGGYPEFRYSLGAHEIREWIRATEDKKGIVRTFTIDPAVAITFRLTPDEEAILSSLAGKIAADGTLQLSAKEAAGFQITILEKNPAPPLVPGAVPTAPSAN
ncbi:MAG: cytochrome c [Verrucomicrobiales bacterium]|nr:cytochrome c [Verrucomicrobiales bacterium]